MHVVKRLRKGNTWSTTQKRTQNYPWLHLPRQTVAQRILPPALQISHLSLPHAHDIDAAKPQEEILTQTEPEISANPKIPPSNIYDSQTIHQEEQKARDLLPGEPDLMNPNGYERLTTVLCNHGIRSGKVS